MLTKAVLWLRWLKCVRIGYPSIPIRKSSSQEIDSILNYFQKNIRKENVKFSSTLQELESVSHNWPHLVQGQKLITSVIYSLNENNHHDDVNFLVNYLLDQNFKIWGGLSTVIIKSYIEQRSWKQAVSWFEKGKLEIKHLRMYDYIIDSLAKNDMLKLSYHYFQEVQQKEVDYLTIRSRNKVISDDTLFQLLQCIVRKSKNICYDCSDDIMSTPDVKEILIVHDVINYIQMWEKPVPCNLVDILGAILKSDLHRYNICFTSAKGLRCLHCDSDLISKRAFSDLCNGVATDIRNHVQNEGCDDELKVLDNLLHHQKYFDIIIDGGNVFYTGHKGKTVPSPGRLKCLLSSIKRYLSRIKRSSHSPKQIALVMPHSLHGEKFDDLTHFIDEFRKNNNFYLELHNVSVKNIHDDLVSCYLAAKSEVVLQPQEKEIMIISNDNYLDFWKIVRQNKYEIFSWLHHRQKNFDKKGNLIIKKNMPPVLRNDNGGMHLISKNGSVCCVKQI